MNDALAQFCRALIESGEMSKRLKAAIDADEPVWDTKSLTADFEVLCFAAPFVVVKRRSDGVRGSLEFTHMPRLYFGWQEDK